MKKTIFIIIAIMLSIQLSAILVDLNTNGNMKIDLTIKDLQGMKQSSITTEKEKDGELVTSNWTGVMLKDFNKKLSIREYKNLVFSSDDNYLVRLSKEDVDNSVVLIALFEDEKTNEITTRLVAPEKSAMFWIRDISMIYVEKKIMQNAPNTIYLAENILVDFPIKTDPEPFIDVKGYHFLDLVQEIFPVVKGDFRLVAKDGTEHTLDFSDYLKEAVLVRSEGGYTLQSPQMPGGMWIKNIAYIQKDETALVFRLQLDSWEEVKELAGWEKLPKTVNVKGKKISTDTSLNDQVWIGIKKLKW